MLNRIFDQLELLGQKMKKKYEYKGDFAIRKKKKKNGNQKLYRKRKKTQKLYKKENKIIVYNLVLEQTSNCHNTENFTKKSNSYWDINLSRKLANI